LAPSAQRRREGPQNRGTFVRQFYSQDRVHIGEIFREASSFKKPSPTPRLSSGAVFRHPDARDAATAFPTVKPVGRTFVAADFNVNDWSSQQTHARGQIFYSAAAF